MPARESGLSVSDPETFPQAARCRVSLPAPHSKNTGRARVSAASPYPAPTPGPLPSRALANPCTARFASTFASILPGAKLQLCHLLLRPDPLLRRLVLYPVELRGRTAGSERDRPAADHDASASVRAVTSPRAADRDADADRSDAPGDREERQEQHQQQETCVPHRAPILIGVLLQSEDGTVRIADDRRAGVADLGARLEHDVAAERANLVHRHARVVDPDVRQPVGLDLRPRAPERTGSTALVRTQHPVVETVTLAL